MIQNTNIEEEILILPPSLQNYKPIYNNIIFGLGEDINNSNMISNYISKNNIKMNKILKK